ncbi:hypothetical protein BGX24_003579 [Mortierella sp. AD032]|nr:hypothetical protein BGX24_003579 [Mortierella sp. AD032]
MGLFDWYPIIRRQGYRPMQLYISISSSLMTGHRLFKVLANCYRVICDAYSNKSQEAAHQLVLKCIKQLGHPEDSVLHFLRRPSGRETENTSATITDVPCMVADSLADSRVIVKNKDKLDFDASIMVFAGGQQTLIPCQESNIYALTVDKIKPIMKEICPPIPQEMTEDAAVNTQLSQDSTTLDDDSDTSDRQVQNIGIDTLVSRFIMLFEQMKVHKPVRVRGSIDEKPVTPGELVRSASVQLAVELKISTQLWEQLWTQADGDQRRNAPNIRAD